MNLHAILEDRFFSVIPSIYRTHCSLTAEVCTRVLRHFGIPAEMMPCQLWCSRPQGRHHVVGFVGRGSTPEKWDGHVVCATPDHLIDTALHHLQREFSVSVPDVLAVNRNRLTSQSIAVTTLAGPVTLQWLHPPRECRVDIPGAPTDLVADLASRLIRDLAPQATRQA